jgi:hypothetical protein
MDLNTLSPKIEALQIGPKTIIFSKTVPTVFINFQKYMGTISLYKTAHVVTSGK